METKNILGMLLGMTVAIICLASIMMPVIDDFNKSNHETYTYESQNGYLAASIGGASETLTADLSLSSNTYTVLVNDVDVTALIPANDNQPILMWSKGYIQVSGTNGTNGVLKAYFHDDTSDLNKVIGNASKIQVSTAGGILTAIFTVSDTDTTYTSGYDWIGYADTDGTQKMILRDNNKPVYFTDLNQIYVAGYTSNSVVTSVGEEVTVIGSVTGTLDITDTALGNGAYSALPTDIDYTIGSSAWNPLYLIVPGEISVQIEGTEAYTSLVGAIPVLIIISIVMAAVAMVVRTKN